LIPSTGVALIFFGPPGAGKGTQAALYAKKHSLEHISTGDLFRANLKNETPVGLIAKGFMSRGVLVPDEIVCQMVREHLLEQDTDSFEGFILDGFPHTVEQAKVLTSDLKRMGRPISGVVTFEIPEDLLIERLTGRLSCRGCGAVFHTRNNPPKRSGLCDLCGSELYTRADDTEKACRERLRVYHDETLPCLDYFRASGAEVWAINADQPIGDVTAALEAALVGR
jgi:adenylate kinase